MPSHLLNRINLDAGIDTNRIQAWYDQAKEQADKYGWSPHEGRYTAFCHAYAQRKALRDGVKHVKNGNEGARDSRALQALIKSTLSEIEAEKAGIHL